MLPLAIGRSRLALEAEATMSHVLTFDPHHAAIRAEMRELRIPSRVPFGTIVFGLMGGASAASAILMLTGL